MADQERSNFRVSVNGEEMTGTDAQEFAQNIASNIAGAFGNVFSRMSESAQARGLNNFTAPLSNLSNLFNGGQSSSSQTETQSNTQSNPLNMSNFDLNSMLPVIETSDDNNQIKMTLNGNTLFDLDLTNLQNMRNNNSNNS
jgi:hypothetical protein